jgi:hypothetical protein
MDASNPQASSAIKPDPQVLFVAKNLRVFLSVWVLMWILQVGVSSVNQIPVVGGLLGLCAVGAWIASVVMAWRLMRAISGLFASVVVTIIAAMPLLNLLAALLVISRTNDYLHERNVPVGFLGPSQKTILELERAVAT